MNTLLATLYRDLTCAAASAAITLFLAESFVRSTAVPPGTHVGAACSARCSPRTPGLASPSRPFW